MLMAQLHGMGAEFELRGPRPRGPCICQPKRVPTSHPPTPPPPSTFPMSILMRLAAAGHLVGSSLAAAPRRVVVGQRRALVTAAKAASVSKADLIKEVAEKGTLTPKQAQAAVNILLETIVTNVSEGGRPEGAGGLGGAGQLGDGGVMGCAVSWAPWPA